MRVLVVSQYFWPEEFRINDLVTGLIERGHEVIVLTNPPNYPQGEIFPSYRQDPGSYSFFNGAEIVRVPVIPRGKRSLTLVLNYLSFVVSAALVGTWRLRRRRFDAIFCFQTTPITAALPALLIGWFKKAPVTMWVLDLWPESLAAVGAVRHPLGLGAIGALVRFIYRRLDRILMSSPAFRTSIVRHGACETRLENFPNWLEPEFLTPAEDRAPETELFSDGFNIMFAGNIGEAQDMPSVLTAAELTRDIAGLRWLIVGDGRRGQATRGEITKREMGDRVVMLGRHPTHRMPSFFAAADALLVSLKDDPLFRVTVPGKVQSYLAAGRPVLAMLTGEGARIVEASGGGLASPSGDPSALAANVRRLIALAQSERQAMGERGRRYCEIHYDRERLFDRLEGWLSTPLGRSRRRRARRS